VGLVIVREISVDQLIADKELIMALFDKYYAVKKDVIGTKELYKSLFNRLIQGTLLLIWGDNEGFLIADPIVNALTQRKEAFIWTVYNPDPEIKPEVLRWVDDWAKEKGLQAIVFMAENPLVFNKIVKDYGYNLTVGYFEKGVE
jgi:hypothetical protein